MSNWIIFYITFLSREFLLKWCNFFRNFCWNRDFLLCTTISIHFNIQVLAILTIEDFPEILGQVSFPPDFLLRHGLKELTYFLNESVTTESSAETCSVCQINSKKGGAYWVNCWGRDHTETGYTSNSKAWQVATYSYSEWSVSQERAAIYFVRWHFVEDRIFELITTQRASRHTSDLIPGSGEHLLWRNSRCWNAAEILLSIETLAAKGEGTFLMKTFVPDQRCIWPHAIRTHTVDRSLSQETFSGLQLKSSTNAYPSMITWQRSLCAQGSCFKQKLIKNVLPLFLPTLREQSYASPQTSSAISTTH